MKMKLSWLITLAFATAAIVVSAWVYQPEPPLVKTVTVERGPISNSIRSIGIVSSTQNVLIVPTVFGHAKEVSVEIGSKVKRGQKLVTLDKSYISQQIAVEGAKVDRLEIEIANQARVLKGSTRGLSGRWRITRNCTRYRGAVERTACTTPPSSGSSQAFAIGRA